MNFRRKHLDSPPLEVNDLYSTDESSRQVTEQVLLINNVTALTGLSAPLMNQNVSAAEQYSALTTYDSSAATFIIGC